MAGVVKYSFEESFDGGAAKRGREEDVRLAAQLAEARAEGEAAGFAAGIAHAAAQLDGKLDILADRLSGELDRLIADRAGTTRKLNGEATTLAFHIARTLCRRLLNRWPLTEVEALIRECFELCHSEARLVIRVADPLLDPLRERIGPLAAQAGFAGKIILIAADDMAPGDCRIEWADGGVEHCAEDVLRDIEARIARFVETSSTDNN